MLRCGFVHLSCRRCQLTPGKSVRTAVNNHSLQYKCVVTCKAVQCVLQHRSALFKQGRWTGGRRTSCVSVHCRSLKRWTPKMAGEHPHAKQMASRMLLFPLPLGPTMQLRPSGNETFTSVLPIDLNATMQIFEMDHRSSRRLADTIPDPLRSFTVSAAESLQSDQLIKPGSSWPIAAAPREQKLIRTFVYTASVSSWSNRLAAIKGCSVKAILVLVGQAIQKFELNNAFGLIRHHVWTAEFPHY